MWEGDADMVQAWKELAFQPIPLAATDIMMGLRSGMIDALMTSPTIMASAGWHRITRHMCKMEIAPMVGGIIVSKKIWQKIPKDIAPNIKKQTKAACRKMQDNSIKKDNEALKIMQKSVLKAHSVPRNVLKEWEKLMGTGMKKLVGNSIHKESYNMILKHIKDYRKKYGKK